MENTRKIIIEPQGNGDFLAFLENNRAIQGCGKIPDAAVGKVIRDHPQTFGISVEMQKEQPKSEPVPQPACRIIRPERWARKSA